MTDHGSKAFTRATSTIRLLGGQIEQRSGRPAIAGAVASILKVSVRAGST